MTRNWFITEKLISIALIIWGITTTYSVYKIFIYLFSSIPWKEISLLASFKNFHIIFFLPLATTIAGLLLFFNKKIGWMMSMITLFLYPAILLIPKDKYTSNIFKSKDYGFILDLILIGLIFLTLLVILLQKPFRIKYNPTKKTWLTITLIIVFIILDKIFVLLSS